MAVNATLARTHASSDQSTITEFGNMTIPGSSTYVTGGFTVNPFIIYAGKGSTPLPSTQFLNAIFFSPLGYIYTATVAGTVMTIKIYTAPNTELANATALTDTVVSFMFRKRKI